MAENVNSSMLTTCDYATNLQEISAGSYVTITALYAICKIDVRILHFICYAYSDVVTSIQAVGCCFHW